MSFTTVVSNVNLDTFMQISKFEILPHFRASKMTKINSVTKKKRYAHGNSISVNKSSGLFKGVTSLRDFRFSEKFICKKFNKGQLEYYSVEGPILHICPPCYLEGECFAPYISGKGSSKH